MRVQLRTFDPGKVEKLGSPNYNFLVTDADRPIVPDGKRLISVLDRGIDKIAVDVTSVFDYKAMYQYYYSGAAIQMNLYNLDKNDADSCVNDGKLLPLEFNY